MDLTSDKTNKMGRRLAELRKVTGISQKEIAEKLGKSVSYVSKLEHMPDSKIKLSDILQYAFATGYYAMLDFINTSDGFVAE